MSDYRRRQQPGVLPLIFLCFALSTACTPGPGPAAPTRSPTTAVLTVHMAGELDLLRPVLAACADAEPGLELLVFEAPVPERPDAAGELTLWFGEPPDEGLEAALLGYDEIVAAAAGGGDWDVLAEAEFRELFTEGGAPETAAVWLPLPGQTARTVLDAFLEGAGYPPEAFLAPDAPAAVEAVTDDPNAIAVIPAAWMTEELQVVFSLGELPVLALTDGVPDGQLRELIGCLQGNPVYGD